MHVYVYTYAHQGSIRRTGRIGEEREESSLMPKRVVGPQNRAELQLGLSGRSLRHAVDQRNQPAQLLRHIPTAPP